MPACLLHSVGPEVKPAALAEFDDSVMAALGRIVACDLPTKARLQAELPTCQGGTGLVPASRLALAAFVAARIESRPIAVSLLEGLAEVFGDASKLTADYSASLEAGRRGLLSQVGSVRQAQVDEAMARGAADAAARFAALRSGQRLPGPTLADVAEAQLVQAAGVDDPEAADAPRLQGISFVCWERRAWRSLTLTCAARMIGLASGAWLSSGILSPTTLGWVASIPCMAQHWRPTSTWALCQ